MDHSNVTSPTNSAGQLDRSKANVPSNLAGQLDRSNLSFPSALPGFLDHSIFLVRSNVQKRSANSEDSQLRAAVVKKKLRKNQKPLTPIKNRNSSNQEAGGLTASTLNKTRYNTVWRRNGIPIINFEKCLYSKENKKVIYRSYNVSQAI